MFTIATELASTRLFRERGAEKVVTIGDTTTYAGGGGAAEVAIATHATRSGSGVITISRFAAMCRTACGGIRVVFEVRRGQPRLVMDDCHFSLQGDRPVDPHDVTQLWDLSKAAESDGEPGGVRVTNRRQRRCYHRW